MVIEYFQHNLVGTNYCVFTHKSFVANPYFLVVAKFKITTIEGIRSGYIKDSQNLKNSFWKSNRIDGEIIEI